MGVNICVGGCDVMDGGPDHHGAACKTPCCTPRLFTPSRGSNKEPAVVARGPSRLIALLHEGLERKSVHKRHLLDASRSADDWTGCCHQTSGNRRANGTTLPCVADRRLTIPYIPANPGPLQEGSCPASHRCYLEIASLLAFSVLGWHQVHSMSFNYPTEICQTITKPSAIIVVKS
jgi:hypothetical protein